MLKMQSKKFKDALTELRSEVYNVLVEDNHNCKHNIIINTGDFFKNHEEELHEVHCSTKSLKALFARMIMC